MPILTLTWILHVLVSFIDLLIKWLWHFGVGLKEISWLNFCCNGRQHQFLFFFEKIDSADCLILYFLLKAAMDTQEGEGQQPADPQPADPAVEEQGMEHWPLTFDLILCVISHQKTLLCENTSSAIIFCPMFSLKTCRWLQ